MKKFSFLVVFGSAILFFSNCGPSKKTTTLPPPKMTYAANLQPVIMANCVPCHVPAKGGNKRPYDNYANVKSDIDEMIRRISLNPGEKGFMPFKKTARLPDSTINAFKQWRTDGALEN